MTVAPEIDTPITHPGRQAAVRRPIAVLMSRFPLVTETFILREMEELERQGQPVEVVPLMRGQAGVVHAEARPWIERALYTPWLSAAILAANLRTLARRPRRYLTTLGRLAAGTARSPSFLAKSLALFPKSVYLAERLVAARIAHVHAHFATHPATAAWIVERLADIPYSVTVHAHDLFVRRALLEEKIRGARFVRAISQFNRDFLAERYPAARHGKVEVIHVGVDPTRYPPGEQPADAARGVVPTLLTVAALKPYKGLPVLLEACARLMRKGIRLRAEVIGEGPLRRRLEREIEIRRLEGVVQLLGARTQDEVARHLGRATAVVLPSVVAPDGQMEGIPVALMEAMVAERPVVAPGLSGIPELVEDGTSGLLFPPGDAEALAAALERLIADPALRRRLGAAGRRTVDARFRLDRTVRALLERIDREVPPLPAEVQTLARLAAPDGAAVGLRRLREGSDSRVAEVIVGGDVPREVVVKQHRSRPGESAPPAERALRELGVLERLERDLNGCGGCAVPHPIGPAVDPTAVLLEPCRGVPLDTVLRRLRIEPGAAPRRRLAVAFRNTGRWLARFQEATPVEGDERAAGDLDALVKEAHRDLDRLASRLSHRRTNALRRRLDALAAPPSPLDGLRRVGRHGDFWPGNVFVGPAAVEVIDFEGFACGHAYEDAAYFLVHAELFFAYPLLRPLFPPLEQAFLDAAFDDGVEHRAFELCRAAAALRSAAAGADAAEGKVRRRRRALLRRALGRPM